MGKRTDFLNDAYFKAGRVRGGYDFAMVLGDVLRSDACKECPDFALRTLFALASQFRKDNNGDLAIPFSESRKYGVEQEWKLRAGLEILELTGIVELTRRGRICGGKGIPSLYALGFRPINASAKYDIPTVVALPAPNRWAKWKRPDDWLAQVQKIKRKAQGKSRAHAPSWPPKKIAHPTREEHAATHVGSEHVESRHTREEQEAVTPATHVGATLKSSGSTDTSQLQSDGRTTDLH